MSQTSQPGTSAAAGAEPLALSITESDREHHYNLKAWQLCALLLTIGRPTPLADLASRWTDFQASPEFVEFLCSIPNSPISLAGDGVYVTLSSGFLSALASYASSLGLAQDAIAPQIRDFLDWSFRKRKSDVLGHTRESEEEEEPQLMPLSKRIRNGSEEAHFPVIEGNSRMIVTEANDMSTFANGSMLEALVAFESLAVPLRCNPVLPQLVQNETDANTGMQASDRREIVAFELNPWLGPPTRIFGHEIFATSSADVNPIYCIEDSKQDAASPLGAGDVNPTQTLDCGIVATSSVDISHMNQREESQQDGACLLEVEDVNQLEVADVNPLRSFNLLEIGNINNVSKTADMGIAENKRIIEGGEEEKDIDPCRDGETKTLFLLSNLTAPSKPPESEFRSTNIVDDSDDMPPLSLNPQKQKHGTIDVMLATPNGWLLKPSATTVTLNRPSVHKTQDLFKTLGNSQVAGTSPQKQHCRRNKALTCKAQKQKQNRNGIQLQDRRGQFTSLSSKDQSKKSRFPDFDSYIIEEEEGSGGYGIVYRALRNSDGHKVAIKCPHADAHKLHVNNELRMLERFGGKNFVIKYEGCLRSGNSDCLILEHVEHDRPELLKREIDVSQLQWYAYCMFRALASLHKQGVAHRDVKPGNFLFCRRTNRGYLIDFNLAMDLHQKFRRTDKSKTAFDFASNHVTHQSAKSELPIASKKHTLPKSSNLANPVNNKSSRSTLGPNSLKKEVGRIRAQNDLSRRDRFKSQGADGSGITSAKEMTSTKNNPSSEKRREPLPCHGRRELINYLQETMTVLNPEVSKAPPASSMRKRVAALPAKAEKEVLYLTPMPLRSNGRPVPGAGLNSKGNGIPKKDSPCAGTKGFRAPEVCFRSSHQGPKIDVWSAGVTLLYLMIGRVPFTGDPEQNIKEIAKLRGSEDLWEVAKLHNRESLFPVELYNTRYLQSMDLTEWCRLNTRRRDFLEVIPRSLLDLVDKCLTVNPRLRISSEDALRHEFFYPLYESLRRQRFLRLLQPDATDSAASTTRDTALSLHTM